MVDGVVDLLVGVRCHQRETDQRLGGRHGRRYHRIYKNAILEKVFGDHECLFVAADVERDDRRGGRADFKTKFLEAVDGVIGQFPERSDPFGFRLEDIQRCRCGGGCPR